ncbi:Cell division protein FtsQ [hydrothermal vent metagenome]|uniref:Cell division protein FtsQ n=1 Tax=hydrothermal vent metagenome TaxID=652676 RepID=A0A3B0SJ14_9ZZZZ
MRILQLRSRPDRRPAKAAPARRVPKVMKKNVSSKASNWVHAKARSVRHGHRPRTMIVGIISGVFSTILLGLWLSGYLSNAYGASLRFGENQLLAVGFSVEHIDIDGATHASEAEVRKALAVEKGELVFGVDLAEARSRIESLGWVRQASVTRLLPNRISVVITERTPFAIWQYNNQFNLVDAQGILIEPTNVHAYTELPLVVGQGAAGEAAGILTYLASKKAFAGKIQSVVRVSQRRWNVQLLSGSKLLLPAANWQGVFEQIAASADIQDLLDMPSLIIDARIAGQLAVRSNLNNGATKLAFTS